MLSLNRGTVLIQFLCLCFLNKLYTNIAKYFKLMVVIFVRMKVNQQLADKNAVPPFFMNTCSIALIKEYQEKRKRIGVLNCLIISRFFFFGK